MGAFDPVRPGQPFVPNSAAHNLFLQTAKSFQAQVAFTGKQPNKANEYSWFWGKLTSDLAAGGFSSPTTCTVDVWEIDVTSGSDPKPLIVSENSELLGITIVNYDASLTATTGTICKVERDHEDRWSLKWIGC